MQTENSCKCKCHCATGVLIALIGLDFLLGAFQVVGPRFIEVSWPILVILLGLKKSFGSMCKCCSDPQK
jgi:hypothetical protein